MEIFKKKKNGTPVLVLSPIRKKDSSNTKITNFDTRIKKKSLVYGILATFDAELTQNHWVLIDCSPLSPFIQIFII